MRTVYCLDIVNNISKQPESYKFGPNKGYSQKRVVKELIQSLFAKNKDTKLNPAKHLKDQQPSLHGKF